MSYVTVEVEIDHGLARGEFRVPADFNSPLPEQVPAVSGVAACPGMDAQRSR